MNTKRNLMLGISAIFAIILIAVVFPLTDNTDYGLSTDLSSKSFRRMYIDSVVMTFTGVLADLKERNEIVNSENIYKARDRLKPRNVSEIFFGRSGEIAFISEELGIAIILRPTVDSANVHGWRCYTYPQESRKTLCETLR